jgi:ABC-type polysaccharide/polyol phosphate transport system ATPase subunit
LSVTSPLLSAINVVKAYGSPVHPLARLLSALLGRPLRQEWHRVLDNVDFEIHSGETVGVLGRNGAGKSTLLAILSGILPATSGTVVRHGRIAPVLEVGQGFDPNLSGADNAAIFCQSFGMDRAGVRRAMPAIGAFADIGDAFDAPMRTYSSGMYARVGFAAAVHVHADLIVLDETLAVGDLKFRMKCYAEIRRQQAEGRAFLLVSHSPDTLADLSDRVVVVDKGRIAFDGEPLEAAVIYKAIRENLLAKRDTLDQERPALCIEDAVLSPGAAVQQGARVFLSASIRAYANIERPLLNVGIYSESGVPVCSISSREHRALPPLGVGQRLPIRIGITAFLAAGRYRVVGMTGREDIDDDVPLQLYPKLAEFAVAPSAAGPERTGFADLGMVISETAAGH